MSQGEEKELAVRLGEKFSDYLQSSQRANQLYGQLLETYRQAKDSKEELEDISDKLGIELKITGLLDGQLEEVVESSVEETYHQEASDGDSPTTEVKKDEEANLKKSIDVDYQQCARKMVEIVDERSSGRHQISDLIPEICQRLDYPEDAVAPQPIGKVLSPLVGDEIGRDKRGPGESTEYYSIKNGESEAETEAAPEDDQLGGAVLAALEGFDRPGRPGILTKSSELLEDRSVRVVNDKLEELTEAGLVEEKESGYDLATDRKEDKSELKKSRVATETEEESTSSKQELTPASLHQARKEAGTDFSLEDYPNFQKLRKIAWELEKDDFPEDLSQLGLGFFHAIGSEKKLRSAQAPYVCNEGEEIEIERYVGKDVYSYRQAAQEDQDDSPFSEAMMMEVAGELIEISLDPNLEESWQREIAEVIENNFPEKKVSQLESSLKLKFGKEVESGNKD